MTARELIDALENLPLDMQDQEITVIVWDGMESAPVEGVGYGSAGPNVQVATFDEEKRSR